MTVKGRNGEFDAEFVAWDWPRRLRCWRRFDGTMTAVYADNPYYEAETAARVRLFNQIEEIAARARKAIGLPAEPQMQFTRDYFTLPPGIQAHRA